MSVRMIRRRRQTKSQPDQPLGMTGSAKVVRGALIWSAMFPNVLTGRRTIAAASEGAYNGAPVGAAGLGRRWTRSANAGVSFGSAQAITQQSGVTVLVVAAPTSAAALKVPFSQRIASGAYTQTDFVFNSVDTGMISTATAGAVMLASYHNAGTGVAATGQVDGKVHCWVAGNGAGNGYIYRDGKKQTLTANTRTPAVLSAAGQQLRIGNIANDIATTWVHDDPLYLVIVWDGLLHESVAAGLSANHRQIERRRRRRVFQRSTGQTALAGIGVAIAGGQANPVVAVPLSAASMAVSGAVATASAGITLSATALAIAAAQAGLSPSVLFAGAAAAESSGNSALAVLLNELAAGAAKAGGSANLTGSAPGELSAAGHGVAAGQVVLAVTVQLQATGAGIASGITAGQAGSAGDLSATGRGVAAGWASQSTLINLTAAGFVHAMGQNAMLIDVPLRGEGVARAAGLAQLGAAGPVRGARLEAGRPHLVTDAVAVAIDATIFEHGAEHV